MKRGRDGEKQFIFPVHTVIQVKDLEKKIRVQRKDLVIVILLKIPRKGVEYFISSGLFA